MKIGGLFLMLDAVKYIFNYRSSNETKVYDCLIPRMSHCTFSFLFRAMRFMFRNFVYQSLWNVRYATAYCNTGAESNKNLFNVTEQL